MHLRFATLCLLLLATLRAAAQDQRLGIQAGIGTGRVRSDIFHNEGGPRMRPSLGLSYEQVFGEHLTLGADLLFQQRGFSDRFTLTDVNGQPTGTAILALSYNYAALPLKVGYRRGNRGFGFGRAGIIPSVLVSAWYKRPQPGGEPLRVNLTGDYRRFDLGGILEAGGGFRLKKQFQFEAALAVQHSITSFTDPWFRSRHLGLYLNLGFSYVITPKKRALEPPDAG